MAKYCNQTLYQCSVCESLFFSLADCQSHTDSCRGSHPRQSVKIIEDTRDICTSESIDSSNKTYEDGESSVPVNIENDYAEDDMPAEKQGDSLTWTNEAVLLLITLKKENASLFNSNTVTQKQAWRKISEEMCKKGHHLTGDECSRKFRSLKNRYKIINERNSKTGHGRQSWRFFSQMQDLMHGDPAVSPIAVASSLKAAIPEDTSKEKDPVATESGPSRKGKRPASSCKDREPSWVKNFREELQSMHKERMDVEHKRIKLEERRVIALEKLVEEVKK